MQGYYALSFKGVSTEGHIAAMVVDAMVITQMLLVQVFAGNGSLFTVSTVKAEREIQSVSLVKALIHGRITSDLWLWTFGRTRLVHCHRLHVLGRLLLILIRVTRQIDAFETWIPIGTFIEASGVVVVIHGYPRSWWCVCFFVFSVCLAQAH